MHVWQCYNGFRNRINQTFKYIWSTFTLQSIPYTQLLPGIIYSGSQSILSSWIFQNNFTVWGNICFYQQKLKIIAAHSISWLINITTKEYLRATWVASNTYKDTCEHTQPRPPTHTITWHSRSQEIKEFSIFGMHDSTFNKLHHRLATIFKLRMAPKTKGSWAKKNRSITEWGSIRGDVHGLWRLALHKLTQIKYNHQTQYWHWEIQVWKSHSTIIH